VRANKVKDGALFVSQSNNSKKQRLTTRTIRNIVKETLNGLGIEKTTHGFRHYFTTTLIKTYKGDLLEVAQYTRHKSLEMLQIYNDNIKRKADLPRYYEAFSGVSF
jgi:integrase